MFGGVSGSGAHRALNGNTAAVSQLQLRCEAIVFEGRRRRRLRKGHHAFPRIYLDSGGAIVGRVCLGEGAYIFDTWDYWAIGQKPAVILDRAISHE